MKHETKKTESRKEGRKRSLASILIDEFDDSMMHVVPFNFSTQVRHSYMYFVGLNMTFLNYKVNKLLVCNDAYITTKVRNAFVNHTPFL